VNYTVYHLDTANIKLVLKVNRLQGIYIQCGRLKKVLNSMNNAPLPENKSINIRIFLLYVVVLTNEKTPMLRTLTFSDDNFLKPYPNERRHTLNFLVL